MILQVLTNDFTNLYRYLLMLISLLARPAVRV